MAERELESGSVGVSDAPRPSSGRDSSGIVVRRTIGLDDLNVIADFEMKLLLHESQHDQTMLTWDCDLRARALAKAAEELSLYQATVLLAEDDGVPAGFVVMAPGSAFGARADCVTIRSMWVEEGARGGLVARKLWNRVQAMIGSATVHVRVNAANTAARKLYQAIGFEDRWISMERCDGQQRSE